ncbi:MAG: NAD(P)/FAD-dependent oxidoreductase [Candidatus Izemoplasmataceae bacterium]
MVDFIIIGGGIIGNFIASKLSLYQAKTILVEKEHDVSLVQTTHNSALVHSPLLILEEKGPLKSRLAKEGNQIYHELVKKIKIAHFENGALVLAFDENEHKALIRYHQKASDLGFEATKIFDKEALRTLEPSISKKVYSALRLPSAMTADTYQISRLLMNHAQANGVNYHFNQTVDTIEETENGFEVTTKEGATYESKVIINAAGIYAEKIAALYEENVPYKTLPHRGDYYVIKPKKPLVKHTLFPLPNEETKGILVIPQPDGSIRLGPTSELQSSFESDQVDLNAIDLIKEEVSRYLENIPFEDYEKMYVGVRSTIDYGDFYIKPSLKNPHFIHVAGIDSPGVTAAPAIANYLVDILLSELDLVLNPSSKSLI